MYVVQQLLFCEVLLCVLVNVSLSYNILVVFPEPTKSHGILGHGYVRNLLRAGHTVTYITPFPWKQVPENLTQIDISSNLNISGEIFAELKLNYTTESKFLLMLAYSFARLSVEHPNVQALLQDRNKHYDAVVAEWIDSEIYSGFAAVYRCPLVWSVSTQMHWQPLRLMDEYPNPAYSADVNSGYTPPLSFKQRMNELWVQIEKTWLLHFTIYPMEVDIYKEFFVKPAVLRGDTLPPYEDVSTTYAMMLVNNHPSIGSVWRLPPNVRDIGGYHIEVPPEPLSKHLQLIMDHSVKGVIYFSLGTTINAKEIPENMKVELLQLFRGLQQTVIWKMEESLKDVPQNVHLLNWAPQTSLLAHRNMKVFISHGGQLSVTESVHFGVPLVAIPRHVDQFANVDAIVKKGIAVQIDFDDDLPEKLGKALAEILGNSSYTEAAKNVSAVYHDRVVPPGVELVHWVEHVVRTRGADHLRSPALMVPWYQKAYLDLVAVILSILIIFTVTVWMIIKLTCSRRKKHKY